MGMCASKGDEVLTMQPSTGSNPVKGSPKADKVSTEGRFLKKAPVVVSHDANATVHDVYELKEVLGKGNFSTVRLGETKDNKKLKVAVKIIIKAKLSASDFEALKAETGILRMLDHPNIIKLYDVFEDSEHYYIVTEYVPGGELFDRIVQKEYYGEEDAQQIISRIAKALLFCHENGVVHRDLKPENILMASMDDDAEIKLCDFGFAKTLDPENEQSLETACGTPGYVAPEIINGRKYGNTVDVWSLGVISYILLCGYPPFRSDNRALLFRAIRRANFEFDSPWWDDVSDEAKDLVFRMLTVDTKARITIPEILNHPWIKQATKRDITPALKKIDDFNKNRRFRVANTVVMVANQFSKIGAAAGVVRKASQHAAAASPEE